MSLNNHLFPTLFHFLCTMVDVRGDVLRPPHGTTPAAVKSNKNQK